MTRQITMEEAAGGVFFPPVRRTALDAEHRALGARMERFGGWWRPWTYGDTEGEYRAVREAVSLGDVSTLGKVIVSGPDAVRFLERIYPCRVGDLVPGRIRYALVLDERGYVFDDGVIVRDGERRFTLTFTTGGATGAEAWLRDWAEGFACDVRIVDRTVAVAAINVTGPRAAELLARCGLAEPPAFMRAAAAVVAGVPCDVMRLGFTGEPSWELHHPADRSVELWRALMAAGDDLGVRPHGLEALLALRLEKGHVIVGMDTDFDSTPRRLGMEWAVRTGRRPRLHRRRRAVAASTRSRSTGGSSRWSWTGPRPGRRLADLRRRGAARQRHLGVVLRRARPHRHARVRRPRRRRAGRQLPGRRPHGARRRAAVLRPGGRSCSRLSPSSRRASPRCPRRSTRWRWTPATVALRLAPDDLLVLADVAPAVADPDAVVVPDAGLGRRVARVRRGARPARAPRRLAAAGRGPGAGLRRRACP